MRLDRRRIIAAAAALPLMGGLAAARRQDDALAALADPSRPDTVMGFGVIARDGAGRTLVERTHGDGRLTVDGAVQTRPFTLDTPMRIASVTKMVVMTALMTLVERGRLSLDEDAGDLAGFPLRHPAYPEVRITPAMLASHTSGLRNGQTYPVPLGRRLSEAFSPDGRHFDDSGWFSPAAEPPGYFTYADANFAVLGQIAERVSGERLDRFLKRTVLDPLGIEAGLNWSGVGDAVRARASAACRIVDGAWTPEVDGAVAPAPAIRVTNAPETPGLTADDYVIGENGFVFSPQGGLRASVRDLDWLARSYAGHPGIASVASRASLERMSAPIWTYDPARPNGRTDRGSMQSYGLSVHIPMGRDADAFFGPDSADWRGHFGQAYGLQSALFWNRRDGRTLAYMISGTPRDAEGLSGARSAASPWEEIILDAALAGWMTRP